MVYPTKDVVEFAGIKLGGKGKGFDHIYKSERISQNGDVLEVLTPTMFGRLILKSRPILEAKYNDEFILSETFREMLVRQVNTIHELKKTILTKDINIDETYTRHKLSFNYETSAPLLDFIHGDQERYIFESASLLRKIHEAGVIWGDAWLGNIDLSPKGVLIPRDFSFRPNPSKNREFLRYKDFINLFLSSSYRTDGDVLDAFLEGYKPSKSIKEELILDIANVPNHIKFVSNSVYFKPVFDMNEIDLFYKKYELNKKI